MPVDSKPSPSDAAAREDALVESILDEALGDFAGLVPTGVFSAIRGCIEDRLRAHPEGRTLLRRASPDAAVEVSGDVATGDSPAPDAESSEEPEAGAG